MLCSFGCKQEGIFQLKNKKWCCSENCSKCPEMRRSNSNSQKVSILKRKQNGSFVSNFIKGLQCKHSWNSGLTKETNDSVKTSSSKLKEYYKTHPGTFTNKHHSLKTKETMRQKKLEFYKNGGQVKCGRCKKIKYVSKIAGSISIDGNWELVTAKYFDLMELHWKRNTKRFSYINLNGSTSTYCPDFWVTEFNSYVEVKGYKTDLDKCKWSQFKFPLIVWDYSKLLEMKLINKSGNILI